MDLPLLPEFTGTSKIVNKRTGKSLREMFANTPDSVKDYARELLKNDWQIICVDQTRGRCWSQSRIITIPNWIWTNRKGADYETWYLSHEMAHAYDKGQHQHGPEFMEWLKKICPLSAIHLEYTYKPRNAAQAGISLVGSL